MLLTFWVPPHLKRWWLYRIRRAYIYMICIYIYIYLCLCIYIHTWIYICVYIQLCIQIIKHVIIMIMIITIMALIMIIMSMLPHVATCLLGFFMACPGPSACSASSVPLQLQCRILQLVRAKPVMVASGNPTWLEIIGNPQPTTGGL